MIPPESAASSNKAEQNQGTLIFVVDDNKLLIEFATTVLESNGYTVKPFSDPRDLLKVLRETSPPPALLVTDYDMDGMNGLDLIVTAQQLLPNLKTLLISGTVDASIAASHPARVGSFLEKPYKPNQLKAIVAQLLAE